MNFPVMFRSSLLPPTNIKTKTGAILMIYYELKDVSALLVCSVNESLWSLRLGRLSSNMQRENVS